MTNQGSATICDDVCITPTCGVMLCFLSGYNSHFLSIVLFANQYLMPPAIAEQNE